MARAMVTRWGMSDKLGPLAGRTFWLFFLNMGIGEAVNDRAAVTHGGLTVTIAENPRVVQPNPLAQGQTAIEENTIIDVRPDQSRMFKFDPGVTLDDLVRTVNAVGAAPGDLMAILEALKEAGAIHGELVVI